MSPEDYSREIARAYQGEVYGEAMFHEASRAATHEGARAKWALLQRLEHRVRGELEPIVRALGVDASPDPARVASGIRDGAALGRAPWSKAMEVSLAVLEPAIERFRTLLGAARREHVDALQLLLDHEVALHDFAARELRGGAESSLEPIQRILAREGAG